MCFHACADTHPSGPAQPSVTPCLMASAADDFLGGGGEPAINLHHGNFVTPLAPPAPNKHTIAPMQKMVFKGTS